MKSLHASPGPGATTFPHRSNKSRNGPPNSDFTAVSPRPPPFQVKHVLSCKGSRNGIFLPSYSRQHRLFLPLSVYSSLWETTPSSLLKVLMSLLSRVGSESPQLSQSLFPHTVCSERVTYVWKLRDCSLCITHPKGIMGWFLL